MFGVGTLRRHFIKLLGQVIAPICRDLMECSIINRGTAVDMRKRYSHSVISNIINQKKKKYLIAHFRIDDRSINVPKWQILKNVDK